MREYWDFKETPDDNRHAGDYIRMVHDELIQVARHLIATGLPETINVEVATWSKFFPEIPEPELCQVAMLAGMSLSTEN
jgi:hypothetical protein